MLNSRELFWNPWNYPTKNISCCHIHPITDLPLTTAHLCGSSRCGAKSGDKSSCSHYVKSENNKLPLSPVPRQSVVLPSVNGKSSPIHIFKARKSSLYSIWLLFAVPPGWVRNVWSSEVGGSSRIYVWGAHHHLGSPQWDCTIKYKCLYYSLSPRRTNILSPQKFR